MSDLLLMASLGLPRNGLVLLADPYRDAYGLSEEARLALQTGQDYSGHGNTLTLGATTNASTDDPTNTGTAWSFDGGDYLTAGRPAQLEISQPFCGYVVAKAGVDGTVMTLLSKNSDIAGGAYGFWLYRHDSANRIGFRMFTSGGTVTAYSDGVFAMSVASGYCGIFFGWDGLNLHLRFGGLTTVPVSYTDGRVDTSSPLMIGRAGGGASYGWTGEIPLVAVWAGVCWPVQVSTRIHNYAKSLMARRGVTLA